MNKYESNEDKKLKKKKKFEEIEARIKKQKDKYGKLKKEAINLNLPDFNNILFKIKEFEKDDNSNGHVKFIYATYNLRATNFRIENCDIYNVKIISENFTPAIASTTVGIVGLVTIICFKSKI